MLIGMIFDLEGKILGAQATGYEGVDKRMDVIAAVMGMKGTVEDLTKLELPYAPAYASLRSGGINLLLSTLLNKS